MDYKPNPELEKLKAEKEKNEKEIEQLDHKITRLENHRRNFGKHCTGDQGTGDHRGDGAA